MDQFARMMRLIKKLRGKDGCPWDREQTIESLRNNLTDEAKEVEQAISKNDTENLKEELGDVIFTAAFIAHVAEDSKLFKVDDVLKTVNEKMIRRHPHVFGDKKASNSREAMKLFLEAKKREKSRRK